MFEVNVPNKAVGEAVEVIDKVEEPGVDAKVVDGWIADIDPDLARSQLLEEIRRPEETKAESPAEAKKLLPQGLLLEPTRLKTLSASKTTRKFEISYKYSTYNIEMTPNDLE